MPCLWDIIEQPALRIAYFHNLNKNGTDWRFNFEHSNGVKTE